MHCGICDREDDLISYNKVTKEFSPCAVCQAIIQETIDGYPDIKESVVVIEDMWEPCDGFC